MSNILALIYNKHFVPLLIFVLSLAGRNALTQNLKDSEIKFEQMTNSDENFQSALKKIMPVKILIMRSFISGCRTGNIITLHHLHSSRKDFNICA